MCSSNTLRPYYRIDGDAARQRNSDKDVFDDRDVDGDEDDVAHHGYAFDCASD
jgi:hypothetical protein